MKLTDLMINDWVTVYIDNDVFYGRISMLNADNKVGIKFRNNERTLTHYVTTVNRIYPIDLQSNLLTENGWRIIRDYFIYDSNGYLERLKLNKDEIPYVHNFQHILRIMNLNELADLFMVDDVEPIIDDI